MMTPDGKFRKREHILKSRDFRVVYREGLSVKSGPLVLCHKPNGLAHNRLGFSVSSGNVKPACRRNRLKRLFREAYRRHRPDMKGASDLVLVAKRALPEKMAYKDAEALFLRLINIAGLAR